MILKYPAFLTCVFAIAFYSCNTNRSSNEEMKDLLAAINKSEYSSKNRYCSEAIMASCDSIINASNDPTEIIKAKMMKANEYLQAGNEQQAIELYKTILKKADIDELVEIKKGLAIAFLRLGERTNCLHNHSGESCVFPISNIGVHADQTGSRQAIDLYQQLLNSDLGDKESKWLLNIAYMTLGEYPRSVPAAYLIKDLNVDTAYKVEPFLDLATKLGLDTKDLGGGNITDDIDNDGYLDIITSSWSLDEGMHYFKNNGNGSFTDLSASSGLKEIVGGINLMQTDYNNDGLKDIFVLRGGWKGIFGKEPASLLKNNGNGTFTDVTKQCGLMSLHPTQTATWADFNNDGWLDVFIGYESLGGDETPCRFYINNKNGTFSDVSASAGCNFIGFVKGVTAGDYNNDGLTDIFISAFTGPKLFKNDGLKNGGVHFTDVSLSAGLANDQMRSFATWFWDYNNDGWPDILACDYEFKTSLAAYAAMEAIYKNAGNGGRLYLFKNNQNGSFTDVSAEAGLTKIVYAMGANFGDIDNDGYPDMYFGTGNPLYQSLIPNKLFRNMEGKGFADVTKSARVGNLQKGHGVTFSDIDNDGDEDIYIEMGGAFKGDAYQNSLYVNPGQNNNHWISVLLQGVTCNRLAIGAHIKLSFKEKGVQRNVYEDVNSGGSFGANPLRQHIGIGRAELIDSLVITWPGIKKTQVFKNIRPDQFLTIKEGSDSVTVSALRKINFLTGSSEAIICAPPTK
ncbi:MAG: CRTAC1 family protein [Ferruginibacter sp.]